MSRPTTDATWDALAALAAAQFGVVSLDQARSVGASPQQVQRAVRAGRLVRAGRGVLRLPHVEPTFQQRLMVAQLRLGPEACVSHRAAAVLHGLDAASPVVELSAPWWRDIPGAVVHERSRLGELETVRIGPLVVTDPLFTLGDLGAVTDADVVERAVESALRLGLVAEGDLRAFARPWDWRGCRGMGVLQEVLDRRPTNAPPTGSDAETVCIQALRKAGEPEPTRQYELIDADGRLVARIDLAYPDFDFGWEIDGFATHGTPDAMQYDLNRQNRILRTGFHLLRFTATDVYQRPAYVVRTIRHARLAAIRSRPRRRAS
jgi:hypothetical protein